MKHRTQSDLNAARGHWWLSVKSLAAIGFGLLFSFWLLPLQQASGEDDTKPKPSESNSQAPAAGTVVPDDSDLKRELVAFTNGDIKLNGWLYKPEGSTAGPGPYPAVIYNHGSDKVPGWFPEVARFYLKRGYVFFVPHRHGHGRSPGDYISDVLDKYREQETNAVLVQKKAIELHEFYNRDVVAAVAWLKQQPFVNPDRMIMSGISYGGIQTVLSAEKGLGLKAFIPFAPAAMSWKGNPLLRERLLTAIKNAKAPVFLLQAENDYNLGPSEVLGKELNGMPKPNRSKLYPPYGETNAQGHGAFATKGSAIWGADVDAFLKAILPDRN
jgi:carboxymethylenebutenolidase